MCTVHMYLLLGVATLAYPCMGFLDDVIRETDVDGHKDEFKDMTS